MSRLEILLYGAIFILAFWLAVAHIIAKVLF